MPNDGIWSSTFSITTPPTCFFFSPSIFSSSFSFLFLFLLLLFSFLPPSSSPCFFFFFFRLQLQVVVLPLFPLLFVASYCNFNKKGKPNEELFSLPFLAPML
jgi:hypothetical protein